MINSLESYICFLTIGHFRQRIHSTLLFFRSTVDLLTMLAALFPVDFFHFQHFVLVDVFSLLPVVPVCFVPFKIMSHSELVISMFCMSTFSPVGTFYYDVLSVLIVLVTNGKSRVQPACLGEWKMCKKKEQIVMLM